MHPMLAHDLECLDRISLSVEWAKMRDEIRETEKRLDALIRAAERKTIDARASLRSLIRDEGMDAPTDTGDPISARDMGELGPGDEYEGHKIISHGGKKYRVILALNDGVHCAKWGSLAGMSVMPERAIEDLKKILPG